MHPHQPGEKRSLVHCDIRTLGKSMCSHTPLEQVSEHYGGDDDDNGEVGCVKPKYGHVYGV